MTLLPDYERHDALGLAALVRDGAVSAQELLDAALERMAARNPRINAVRAVWPDRARDSIAAGIPAGPFAGVPFLVKDLGTAVEDAPLTNGSAFFAGFCTDHDSELVRRYRRAGLVLFGRSAAPELGLGMGSWQRFGGLTRNPWNLDHFPEGSSGGAAAAVAAGIVPMAHGSDGGGSLRMPASCNGLVALKPTRGRNPVGPRGVEGMGGMSVEHVLTRSIRDSAAALDATAGPDVGAPYFAERPAAPFLSSVATPPARLRIALSLRAPGGGHVDPECIAAARSAARLCEELGHTVTEADPEIRAGVLAPAIVDVLIVEIAGLVAAHAGARGAPAREKEFEPTQWGLVLEGRRLPGTAYAAGLATMQLEARRIAEFFTDFDVLITPTSPIPPPAFATLGDKLLTAQDLRERFFDYVPFTMGFNVTGQPALSLPLHWTQAGLPVGVQFVARYGAEALLFSLGGQLEAAAPWFDRRPHLADP